MTLIHDVNKEIGFFKAMKEDNDAKRRQAKTKEKAIYHEAKAEVCDVVIHRLEKMLNAI